MRESHARKMSKAGSTFLLFLIATGASAQDTSAINLSVLRGDGQLTASGQVFAHLLTVRLTDARGVPFANTPVYFENEGCFVLGGLPCEFPAPPGHFESGSDNATVLTDSTGVAVAPPYYAGVGSGAIGVSAYALSGQAPYFFSFNEVVGHIVDFRLTETPEVASVPSLSFVGACLLIVLLTLTPILRRRVGFQSGHLRSMKATLTVGALLALLEGSAAAATNWLQFGYDQHHSGNNTAEHGYSTPTGNRLAYRVDLPKQGDSTPIFLSGVNTSSGTVDLLFFLSNDGTLFAINAANGSIVWSRQPVGAGQYTTGSPAIDPSLAYVYAFGLDGKIHRYDVSDGTEFTANGWPQTSTVKPYDEKGAGALTIATAKNGVTYLYSVTSSYFDGYDYQGHITTIDLSSNAQVVFNGQCSELSIHYVENGMVSGPGQNDCVQHVGNGGSWGVSGATYDSGTDRVFFVTANGPFDPNNVQGQGRNWSDTIIALGADGAASNGTPLDSYTPSTYATLQTADADLGSSSLAVLPAPPLSKFQHLGVQAGKDGCVRLLNLANLSGTTPAAAGHVGGHIQAQPLSPMYDGCSSGAGEGDVVQQPAVWASPADGSTWVYIYNSAYKLVVDLGGNPSLQLEWSKYAGSSAIVANGQMYDNGIEAVDVLTGKQIWGDPTGSVGAMHWAAPILANGRLYVVDCGPGPFYNCGSSSALSVFILDGIHKDGFDQKH